MVSVSDEISPAIPEKNWILTHTHALDACLYIISVVCTCHTTCLLSYPQRDGSPVDPEHEVLPGGKVHTLNSTLVIRNATSSHAGLYHCVVEDGHVESGCNTVNTRPCIATKTLSRGSRLTVVGMTSSYLAV